IPRDYPRHGRLRIGGEAGARACPQPGWTHRQSYVADARAGLAARHAGLSRLGWSDRSWLRAVEYLANARIGADEYVGLGVAALRVPSAGFPLADDACAPAWPVSAWAAQCAGGPRGVSVGCRSEALPRARAGGLRGCIAGSSEPFADVDMAPLDTPE